jgi:hypothetical protein
MSMKLGLWIPTGTRHEFAGLPDASAPFRTIRALAVAADECGFDCIYAPEHFVPFRPGPDPVALARETDSGWRLSDGAPGSTRRRTK